MKIYIDYIKLKWILFLIKILSDIKYFDYV